MCSYFQQGLQTIRKWTKESLLEKPFCTAKGKIWTETPSDIPLDEIYTKLRVVKKVRNIDTVEATALEDLTQLFNQENNGPVRILATGNFFHQFGTNYQFHNLFLLLC